MATITKESIGTLHEKITVKVDTADYLPGFEKALKEYSKKANIPGFRPGMVPKGMVKKMYGQSLFMDEVLKSVDKGLIDYLQNEKIEIFAQPLPMDTDMAKLDVNNFDFEVGLKPEIELPAMDSLKITGYNIKVTDEMVKEQVEKLQNQYANRIGKTEVDNEEDFLTVTFSELGADGEKVEGGIVKHDSFPVKYFTENLRKEAIDKKEGDTLQITLGDAFAEKELEYVGQSLGVDVKDEANKQKQFELAITMVQEYEKRALDESFFNQLFPAGDVKTEEDFSNKIKEDIQNYWAAQSRNQIHDQLFHQLVDNTSVNFPDEFLKKWLKVQNGQDGQPAKTDEQIEKDMPSFLNQLKWTLISDKIVVDQSISVAPEEIQAFAKQQLMGYMGGNIQDMDDQPWVNDYVERMMKDRRFVEDSYNRIQSQKLFEWAEKEVKPEDKDISVEDFTKMVEEHQHHHHEVQHD